MSYKLADGTMSSEYELGDKFILVGDSAYYPKGSVVSFYQDDRTDCPKFTTTERGSWYVSWGLLESYKEDTQPTDNKQEGKGMKIEIMDYVNTKDFALDELMEFESLIVKSGYKVDEEIDFSKVNTWEHYGVTPHGYTGFYDNYFKNEGGRNVSEQFRKYLDSPDSWEEQSLEEDTPDNLSVKDRLLALADGKELEFFDPSYEEWESLEYKLSFFGDNLYDETLKFRIKEEKSDVEKAFDNFALSEEFTTFDIFKAGYQAAKDNA